MSMPACQVQEAQSHQGERDMLVQRQRLAPARQAVAASGLGGSTSAQHGAVVSGARSQDRSAGMGHVSSPEDGCRDCIDILQDDSDGEPIVSEGSCASSCTASGRSGWESTASPVSGVDHGSTFIPMDIDDLANVRRPSGSLDTPQMSEEQVDKLRNRERGQHGCSHYKRRCKLVAPCCQEVFHCRLCHDQHKDTHEYDPTRRHKLERTHVREVVCSLCDQRQPVAYDCRYCGVRFGAYTCMTCVFFDDAERGQFHCKDCGICRVGGADKFFHCTTCGCCYSKSLENNHICVENSMHQNCPVCFEYLFDSVMATAVLPCGHTIHSTCLKELEENRHFACPTCKRSYKDMTQEWEMLNLEVLATPMPPVFANWRASIKCYDCGAAAIVPYHVVGLKCPSCSSYNTARDCVLQG